MIVNNHHKLSVLAIVTRGIWRHQNVGPCSLHNCAYKC